VKTRVERSAGGVVFRDRDGGDGARDAGFDIAIIKTHEGRWQLPKGWIEHGEAPETAAVREVREEAGVDADVVGPLGTVEYWFNSTYEPEPARVHKFVQFYLLRYVAGTPDDHDDEVLEARWAPIDEALATLDFKDERRIVQTARDALEAAARENSG
jgi:8-oxo-dGTP pyrophosphatase MutT (NUDIX family)